jgi:hypothetical protein
VAVRVDEPGKHTAPGQVDHRLRDGQVDVAAPSRERDAAIPDHEGVHHRGGGIHRVDAAVGQHRHGESIIMHAN